MEFSDDVGDLRVRGQSLRFDIETIVDQLHDSNVLLGFRPRSVELGSAVNEAHFEEELVLLEPIDDRALAQTEGPDGDI